MENTILLKKNDIYTAHIEGYSSEALGVCHIAGRAVFVPGTIIGETWEIRILKVSSTAIYGRGERLIIASNRRRESSCPYFGRCGGCDTWHMSYEAELEFKLKKVNDALEHIGRQSVKAEEIIGSDSYIRYRNKGIMAVSENEGRACAGFFRERSHQLVKIGDCLIQNELCGKAATAMLDFVGKYNVPAYSELSGKGTVRHVYCRRAYYGNDAVVCIVAARGFGAMTQKLVEHMRDACPELSGIVLNINKNSGNTVLSGEFYTLWGDSNIRDSLCGIEFEISPRAFFQINPPQAERLYRRAMEYANVGKEDMALDLYCGAGTISLCLAKRAGHVIGAEIVPQAIENAKENAQRNGIINAEFICADAGQCAAELAGRGLKPEVIVVDPPRKGMDAEAVNAVCTMQPRRVVYVSCNPATLARDIISFNNNGYTLIKATAVDMFPRTSHVETVVLLSQQKPDDIVRVSLDLSELDITAAEQKASYGEIKEYVLAQTGLKVSSLYIAQVKQKYGIIERENYNKSKNESAEQPICPPDKEAAIVDALRHFKMIGGTE